MLNNREWAILFWLAVVGVLAFTRRDVRSSFVHVLRSAAEPKILVPLAVIAIWVSLEVWLATQAKLWVPSLFKNTVIWFITSGLVLFFNFEDASKQPDFLRRKAVAALGPVVLMEVMLDIFVLPLLAEIVLQLVLAILVMIMVIADMKDRYRQVGKLARGLIGLIVLLLILRSVVKVLTNWDELDNGRLLLEAVLPGWLTLGLLPFIYAVALYASYELVFLRVDWNSPDSRKARLRGRLALLTSFHVRAHELASFAGAWPQRISTASSFGDALAVVRDFRSARREAARAEAEARERLIRFAGVNGVDEHGKRLDRREFEQTTDALRWLAVCMMGWYRHHNRYQADLIERVGDDFTPQGLDKPSGITMRVADDGQAWYAWRRTVTGWCFAIGAAGPPPDQWEYDGSEPPGGFPGEDRSWGTHALRSRPRLAGGPPLCGAARTRDCVRRTRGRAQLSELR